MNMGSISGAILNHFLQELSVLVLVTPRDADTGIVDGLVHLVVRRHQQKQCHVV